MPPPITRSRFGTPSSSSAPVESITRGSSCGMKGILIGSDPAAITALSKPMTVVLPSCSTAIWCGLTKRAVPVTTVTLRCLARPPRPPVRRLTTPSFQLRS